MKRLLVVDDEDHTRLICRRVAARHGPSVGGVEVHEAGSGEEALRLLASVPFDCVLTDYRMGEVSGIDVLEAALAGQPRAARVLMSGFIDPRALGAAQARARIHAFIEKPMAAGEFESILRRDVLERHLGPGVVA